ncbi:MAG: hypothetical protein WCS72_15790 [Deltaproteobacteria bacterium]
MLHSALVREADVIHVVEPTLKDQRGHCYSFNLSLCRAAGGAPIRLWAARGASLPGLPPGVEVVRHFHRALRRIQAPFLYRRLLAGNERVLVSTAERTDLLALDLASGGRPIPPGRFFLYFHWFTERPGKRQAIERLARRQPGLGILGPTETVVGIFRECGFPRAALVPYPISQAPTAPEDPSAFRRVLFAGAPRSDKGFGEFVGLVEELARTGASLPVAFQADLGDVGRYRADVRVDLERVRALGYPAIEVLPDPLPADQYAGTFRGGICVQPYQARKFVDRVSGVTLDALTAGCPVVAVEGTWSARVVERFGAGRVVPDTSPATLLSAVRAVEAGYEGLAEGARRAGRALLEENDARALYDAVTGGAPGESAPETSA